MGARPLWLGILVLASAACGDSRATDPSASARVIEAGWSFGFCLGSCLGKLDVQGDALVYRVMSHLAIQEPCSPAPV